MAKAKKYKVMAGEEFIGHYHANSPLDAVKKGITANYRYRKDLLEDPSTIFSAQKGSMNPVYKFAASGQAVR
jgi:hypothetical protein